MNLEEFSSDIQKMCIEELTKAKEVLKTLPGSCSFLEENIKAADLVKRWAMLWVDVEKRKAPKEIFISKGTINIDDIKMAPITKTEPPIDTTPKPVVAKSETPATEKPKGAKPL